MDGRASCAALILDGSSVVPVLQKDHLAGSHMLRCCNLANAPAAHIGEGQYMIPYLEAARKSPGLEVAAAFACCAEVVAEMVGCQVHRMSIALQNDCHLMEQRCCMVLA